MCKIEFKTYEPSNFKSPYLTIGELLKKISRILESEIPEHLERDFKRLVNDEVFDEQLIKDLCEEIFTLPFSIRYESSKRAVDNFKADILKGEYTQWVKSNSLVWFRRSQSSPILCEEIGTPTLVRNLLEFFKEGEDSKLLQQLMLADSSMSMAWETLQSEYPQFAEFRSISNLSKEEMENSLDWLNEKHQPKNTNLFPFLEKFYEFSKLSEDEIKRMNGLFFAAKCLTNIWKMLPDGTSKELVLRAFAREPGVHAFELMWKLKMEDEKFDENYKASFEFLQKAFSSAHKELGLCSKEKVEEVLGYLISLAPHPEIHWWQRSRIMAKYALYSGQPDKALDYYKECMKGIWYTGDPDLEEVYKEALSLGAMLHDRPFLKQMKQRGILFGFYGGTIQEMGKPSVANNKSRSKDHTVEDWEVDAWANEFHNYFPKECFWDDVLTQKKKFDKSGFINISPKEMSREPNLKKPDQKYKIGGKVYPQIVWFTEKADYEAVQALLKADADVNALSSSGESALFFAIQMLNPTLPMNSIKGKAELLKEKHFFDLISGYPHSRDCLNTPVSKKKWTCLGCAVETGLLDVVESVLELGADVNQYHSEDFISPLYKAITQLGKVDWEAKIDSEYFDATHPEILEGIRRGHPELYSKTNPETIAWLQRKKKDTEFRRIFKIALQMNNIEYDDNSMIEIITAILSRGGNPNQIHHNGELRNYTPLMLSAEKGNVEAFDLLVKAGGDLSIECTSPTNLGYRMQISCRDIANNWGANKITEFLDLL